MAHIHRLKMKKRLNAQSVMVMVTSSSGVLITMVKEKLIVQIVTALVGNVTTCAMGQDMKTAPLAVDEEGLIAFRARVLDARSVPVAMDMGLTHEAINADGAGDADMLIAPHVMALELMNASHAAEPDTKTVLGVGEEAIKTAMNAVDRPLSNVTDAPDMENSALNVLNAMAKAGFSNNLNFTGDKILTRAQNKTFPNYIEIEIYCFSCRILSPYLEHEVLFY